MNRERSAAEFAIEQAWISLIRDYVHDRITKEEFEKRKKVLELKGLKIEKVDKPAVPVELKKAEEIFNKPAVKDTFGIGASCPVDKEDNVPF